MFLTVPVLLWATRQRDDASRRGGAICGNGGRKTRRPCDVRTSVHRDALEREEGRRATSGGTLTWDGSLGGL